MQAHNRNARNCSDKKGFQNGDDDMYDAKRSKLLKRTKVLWSFSDPCDPSVFPKPRSPQCCRPDTFACAGKKVKTHLLYLSAETFTHICKQFFLNWIRMWIPVWREGERRKDWHYMFSIRFSRQSFLTIERAHISRNSLPKMPPAATRPQAPWLNPYVVRPSLSKAKKGKIFLPNTHKFQFGKKHATQNFYVFKLEKHPKVS